RERLSNQLLVGERTVRLRCVKKRYAALDCRAKDRDSGLPIGAGAIDRRQTHRAVTKRGNLRPKSPQLTRLHCRPRSRDPQAQIPTLARNSHLARSSCKCTIQESPLWPVDLLANGVHPGKVLFPMADELDGMATFVAVAEAKGFRAASDRLGVTHSAVSQAVRRLEERLGVALVRRTTRSVHLTDAGERLYAAVRPALDEVRGAVAAVGEMGDEPRGTLRIHSSSVANTMFAESILFGFLARY